MVEVRLFFRASNFASSLVTLMLEIAVLIMRLSLYLRLAAACCSVVLTSSAISLQLQVSR